MRKIFTLLVLLAILPLGLRGQDVEGYGLWGENEVQGFNGEGSVNSPYEISTAAELAYLAQQVNGGKTYSGNYFILTNDIVLNEEVLVDNGELKNSGSGLKVWTPIGNSNNQFAGIFIGKVSDEGENPCIKGMYINNNDQSCLGLFGYLAIDSEVKNITVSDSFISYSGTGRYLGGIAGCSNGSISYCINYCNINSTTQSVGGIVGFIGNNGCVNNCINNGNISGTSKIGGIVGNCSDRVSSITKCINNGNISATESSVGGILGYYSNSGISLFISYCENNGLISGSSYVGGIAGEAYYINYCHNNSEVKGTNQYIGGIVGFRTGHAAFCHNKGNVISGNRYVGGIFGGSDQNTCYNSYNEGNVTGKSYVGGIGGDMDAGGIERTYNKGTITTTEGSTYKSGICYIYDSNYSKLKRSDFEQNYYLEGTCEGASKGKFYTGESRTSDEFKSGQVAVELKDKASDETWRQDIGVDYYPVLEICDSEAKVVFVVEFYKKYNDLINKCYLNEGSYESFDEFVGDFDVTEGKKLVGWSSKSSGDDVVVFPYEINSNKSFYAKIEDKTYTVSFEPNYEGANQNMDSQEFTYNISEQLDKNVFSRDGYIFENWNTQENRKGTFYVDQAELTLTGDEENIILYAQWKANTYTVKFDANGGLGNMDDQSFIYDKKQNLAENKFSREGYTFAGWSMNNNDAELKYTDGQEVMNLTVNNNEEITLYAQWKLNTYKVDFNANGGKGEMESQQFSHGVAQKLKENKFTKYGYTLTSWNTSADGQGIKYEIGKDIQVTSDLTLYAQWEANTYIVKFNANGGEGTMDDIQLTYDQSKALTKNNFTKAGYTFVGWSTVQDGEVIYGDEENVENLASEGEFTLYAVWRLDTSVGGGYHDLYIVESVGAELISRYDKDRTPDGGSFTLSLEKEEGYEDCEPTVYYKRGRFGEWKELKLDEVSGYYQIRSVYTDIYVKVSGDGIWPVSNEEVEAQEVKVYTQNGAIVVVTPSVMDVQVVSMTGSVVAADKVAGQREFRNLVEGVYIVRVEDEIVKVRL